MSVEQATLTDKTTVITSYFYEVLEANKGSLGIRQVFDGDRQLIAETPTVAVIAGDKSRELYGASLMTTVSFTVYLLVYHKRIDSRDGTGPVEGNERDVQALSESIEALFHRDVNLNGRVQHGMFTRIEPGYANRDEKLMRTTRMTWEGVARSNSLLVQN